ncbi:MAG: RND transporter [Candidatus Binatia bacterium]|nr:MAG: RND transporter [Candidatus Binatia bacterium]
MRKSAAENFARVVLVFLGGFFLPRVAGAQPPEGVPRLTLRECLERARSYHPDLAPLRWDVEAARARLREAEAGRYPTASVTSITGVVPSVRGQVHEPPIDTVSKKGDLGPFTRVELEFVQPLFTWGKIRAGREAARHGLEREKARGVEKEREVLFEVKKQYYGVLLSSQVAGLLDEVQRNFEKAVSIAERRLLEGEGTVTQADVLKLRVGLAGIARELHKARAGAELSKDALARSIGFRSGAEFELAERNLVPVVAELKSLEEYAAEALSRSPEWKQLVEGIEAKKAQVRMARSEFLPSFFVAGGFRYGYAPFRERQLSPFAKDDFNFLDLPGATFGIRWPLDFFRADAEADRARAELESLEARKRGARSGIRLAVKRAYLETLQTRAGLSEAGRGRKAARGLLLGTVSGFELGVGEAKDVFEALVVYTQATSAYYEAVHDYNVAVARLSKVVGEEIERLGEPSGRQ